VDPQNVETIVSLYFDSVKDGQNRHLIAQKYGKNLADASTADIELDGGVWFAGFGAAIRLVDPKAKLPTLEMVLGGITKSFETEIAA
jgi:hypothetical protein